MSNFQKWITQKLGYKPRNIDLANLLGEQRGELVRKWMNGQTYPDKNNCVRLAKLLKLPEYEVQKDILQVRMDDLDEI